MPLLLDVDTVAANALAQRLGDGVEILTSAEDLEVRLQRAPHFVVVLGPGLALQPALAATERLRLTHPATTVVLTRDVIETDIYAPALQAGVSAVVRADDDDALATALFRAGLTWEAINGTHSDGHASGRVVTVFSPKGGVGKTTMSLNLALALTALGSRVCVLDLDLAFGDVAITLQLIPSHTLADAAGLEDQVDWSMVESLLTEHRSGLRVLAAPTNPEGRERITAPLVRTVVRLLRERFDHVVVDTPPGFDEQVLGAFDETDDLVVVGTLDVPTIKNVKVAMETLDLLDLVPRNRHLVVNRADEAVGLTASSVSDLLGVPIDLTLPSDLAVACATNNGDPLVAAHPDHAVARAITGFARTLPGVAAGPAPQETAARRGLFGRRRKESVS